MTKTRNCLSALCLMTLSAALCAAPSAPNDAPPPYAGDVKVEKPLQQPAPAARRPAPDEANPLLPSKADMEKAREERAHGHVPPSSNAKRRSRKFATKTTASPNTS